MSHKFFKTVNNVFCFCKTHGSDHVREMSREHPRRQPGTIQNGLVEPREWSAPDSHVATAKKVMQKQKELRTLARGSVILRHEHYRWNH
jgi:hypothetical protein